MSLDKWVDLVFARSKTGEHPCRDSRYYYLLVCKSYTKYIVKKHIVTHTKTCTNSHIP